MHTTEAPQAPPFCPNPACRFHRQANPLWRYIRYGFYGRRKAPFRVQRFRCVTCRRAFGTQTFHPSYWLKFPELQVPVFFRLVGGSGLRQIAREYGISPQTALTHTGRLGRHCLLFHEQRRPRGAFPEEQTLDSFESFEWSQFHPTGFHFVAGQESHFFHGFTDTERRRSGRMTPGQRRTREKLEILLGKPDPRSTEKEVAALLRILAPRPQAFTLHSDEHQAYPRAIRKLTGYRVSHRTISSRAARTPRNPLFPINLLDLLVRHSSANHKRETLAFSKRRQGAINRLWVFAVWRNFMKSFSEQKRDASPAMRLGLVDHRLSIHEVLAQRLFPSRIRLPERWQSYYWQEVKTRAIKNCSMHQRVYAF